MTVVAAIDIGTNSARLLVAEVLGDDAEAKFVTRERRTQVTRLGAGVDRARRLDPAAIERTLEALRGYRRVIDEHGAVRIRATATSAARDAANRDDFFGPAAEVLGVRPELLSGEEEARLTFTGAVAGRSEPGPFLVVDIGGGSTEFVFGDDAARELCSIDVGCVRLTEQFLHGDPPTAEELSQAVSVVRDHLADVDRLVPGAAGAAVLIGTAGTAWTFGAVELGVDAARSDLIDGFRLGRPVAEEIFRTLATEPIEQRRHNPGLEPGRVDVIVGGAVVLVSVMRHWGFDEMIVSESDILDGLARSLA